MVRTERVQKREREIGRKTERDQCVGIDESGKSKEGMDGRNAIILLSDMSR